MEKNPVFEFSSSDNKSDVLPPDSEAVATADVISKAVSRRRVSGKVCVAGTFAAVAVLALLVLVGVVIMMALRPNTNTVVVGQSDTEQKSIIENIGKRLENVTSHIHDLIKDNKAQENMIEFLKLDIQQLNKTNNANLDILSRNLTSEVVIICEAKINATQSNIDNVTETIQQSLIELTRKHDEEIVNLGKFSNESVQELYTQYRVSHENLSAEIESVQRRQHQNALDCSTKINQTQSNADSQAVKINTRIDQVLVNLTTSI